MAKDVIFIRRHFVRFLRLFNMEFNAGHFLIHSYNGMISFFIKIIAGHK